MIFLLKRPVKETFFIIKVFFFYYLSRALLLIRFSNLCYVKTIFHSMHIIMNFKFFCCVSCALLLIGSSEKVCVKTIFHKNLFLKLVLIFVLLFLCTPPDTWRTHSKSLHLRLSCMFSVLSRSVFSRSASSSLVANAEFIPTHFVSS